MDDNNYKLTSNEVISRMVGDAVANGLEKTLKFMKKPSKFLKKLALSTHAYPTYRRKLKDGTVDELSDGRNGVFLGGFYGAPAFVNPFVLLLPVSTNVASGLYELARKSYVNKKEELSLEKK